MLFFPCFGFISNFGRRSIRTVELFVTLVLKVLHYLRYDFEQFELDMGFGCLLDTTVVGKVLELDNLQ